MTVLTEGLPTIPLANIVRLTPAVFAVRNSKNRPMSMHLFSAPGIGKTMTVRSAAAALARTMPGVPVGFIVANPPILAPNDIPGVMLFETSPDGRRSASYTRPVIWRLSSLLVASDDGTVEEIPAPMTWAGGTPRPLYAGDEVVLSDGRSLGPVNDGILLLDEFMQAPADIQAALAPLLDEGRAGTHVLPGGWGVWAASNRAKDQSGTRRHLAFLTNRVCMVEIEGRFDGVGGLRDYLLGAGPDAAFTIQPIRPYHVPCPRRGEAFHPALLAFAETNAAALFDGVPADPGLPFMTPRSYELACKLFHALLVNGEASIESRDSLSLEDSDRRMAFTALAGGAIGKSNTTALVALASVWNALPTIDEIVTAHNSGAPIEPPSKTDEQLLMAYRVAENLTPRNADALFDYLRRMRPAFLHVAVVTALTRPGAAALYSTKAFREYCSEHRDVHVEMLSSRLSTMGRGK